MKAGNCSSFFTVFHQLLHTTNKFVSLFRVSTTITINETLQDVETVRALGFEITNLARLVVIHSSHYKSPRALLEKGNLIAFPCNFYSVAI